MNTSTTPARLDRSRFLDDPRLLERELMGLRLHELVAALASVDNSPRGAAGHGKRAEAGAADAPRLTSALRDYEAEVLERGLGVLPRSRLQMLLDQPAMLLDLQELLLGRGGLYWDQVTESLPDTSRVRLSEPQWQERLERTFVRGARSGARASGDSSPSVSAAAKPSWVRRRSGPLAAVLLTATLLGVVAGWYRAERRLAEARRQHADEVAALQSGRDAQVAALQQQQAGERVAAYCRLLNELSWLPAAEQLVSLPADAPRDNGDCLPPDEDLAARERQLPAVEESLIAPSARELAIDRVAEAMRADAAAWAELTGYGTRSVPTTLTGDARRYLAHPDPAVRHGASMALGKDGPGKTE